MRPTQEWRRDALWGRNGRSLIDITRNIDNYQPKKLNHVKY